MAGNDSDYDNLEVRRRDGVARVTIDSTSKNNAINVRMAEELLTASVDLAEDESVRCIVLTGSGDAFCSGADAGMLEGAAEDAPLIRRATAVTHEAVLELFRTPTPVVSGVNGVAAGAGFSFAIFADLTLVSSDARLEFAYPQIGLTGDAASTFFLPRLVGLQRAKEIVLLNEPIDPEEAVELGLATEAVPADRFEDRLVELVDELAAGPTVAYGALKHLLTRSFERSIEEQLSAELEALARTFNTDDYRRGYESLFSEERPEFRGH